MMVVVDVFKPFLLLYADFAQFSNLVFAGPDKYLTNILYYVGNASKC